MNRNMLYTLVMLTAIWITLMEAFTVPVMVSGIVVSVLCIYIYSRLLPLPKRENINYFRLAVFPFYLIGQVYFSAFNTIILILKGADADVIKAKTQFSNGFLRTILANSITLTPGSVSLELKDDEITLLWLKGKKDSHEDAEKSFELTKIKLEKMLLKAEK